MMQASKTDLRRKVTEALRGEGGQTQQELEEHLEVRKNSLLGILGLMVRERELVTKRDENYTHRPYRYWLKDTPTLTPSPRARPQPIASAPFLVREASTESPSAKEQLPPRRTPAPKVEVTPAPAAEVESHEGPAEEVEEEVESKKSTSSSGGRGMRLSIEERRRRLEAYRDADSYKSAATMLKNVKPHQFRCWVRMMRLPSYDEMAGITDARERILKALQLSDFLWVNTIPYLAPKGGVEAVEALMREGIVEKSRAWGAREKLTLTSSTADSVHDDGSDEEYEREQAHKEEEAVIQERTEELKEAIKEHSVWATQPTAEGEAPLTTPDVPVVEGELERELVVAALRHYRATMLMVIPESAKWTRVLDHMLAKAHNRQVEPGESE